MVTPASSGFDVRSKALYLEDGGDVLAVDLTPTFWQELITGETTSAEIKRMRERDGRLMIVVPQRADANHWEMHPSGEEVLCLVSGAVDVVMEDGGGDRVVELQPDAACIVPRGVWHRLVVHQPGDLLAITYGRGTQHRPRKLSSAREFSPRGSRRAWRDGARRRTDRRRASRSRRDRSHPCPRASARTCGPPCRACRTSPCV